ncbi:MAG TPA: zinc-dependent alcohol dehydrogenase family protein [Stellaceae bacterium]|nr:zinc-dependent alcohol dehydrogenase family protein [Stellaceae bacterium]
MKKIEITDFGAPEAVARCVEAPDVGAPGAGEIVFDVLAFPINPADLSFCRGRHPPILSLPATPGAECVGRVAAVGAGVNHVRPGDLVVSLQRENWVERRRIDGDDAIPLPADLDLAQAAMLRINPATALCLLEDHAALRFGDWVIQNVANSAVGRHLTVLAKRRGVHMIAVVRRDDVAAELQALGADAVLEEGPDLAERAQAAAGGAPIRLGIDAIGGEASKRIGDSLAAGGIVVSYGALSGSEPMMSRAALMRGVGLTGFGLSYGLAQRTKAQVRELYADLAAKMRAGILRAPVEATYPIDDITEALIHAQRRGRHGKVLVLPNGEL